MEKKSCTGEEQNIQFRYRLADSIFFFRVQGEGR